MTRGACHAWAVRWALGIAVVLPGSAAAQGGWSLSLFVNPFPSPYQSDWETNQTISSLTIANPGASHDVRLVYQITNTQGRLLASGGSEPLGITPGAPTVLTSILDIAGASRRDQGMWDQMQRTGRIPEGTYRACVVMASAAIGLVLGEDCASFTIVYPDAPQLIAPGSGDVLTTQGPFFQWTPVQVPPAYPVEYVLQVAEVLANQTADEALAAGIPHYQQPDLTVTNIQYPTGAQPFEPGKRYAWRVLAMDASGFPPTANGGLSEIRTFLFDDGTGTNVGIRSPISLTLTNDFDADSSGGSAVVTTDTTTVDVGQVCASWHRTLRGVTVSSASPIGLRRFAGQPAVLFRDSTAMKWWIATNNPSGQRSVLVGGDCLTFKDGGTRLLWIASRDSGMQQEVSKMLAATPLVDSLWGFVVLSKSKTTVAVPAAFDEGRKFLRDQTLDVAPGINAFMSLSMKEWPLWPFFQLIGYTEKTVEVKGFLGWDATWHIGGAVGDKTGVDLSTERKFLVLEASLPKRKPIFEFVRKGFESSQLSFEVSVGDSTGRGFTLAKDATDSTARQDQFSYSFDVIGKLKVTFTINEDLALVGSVGFDEARESKKAIGRDVLSRMEWLRGAAYGRNAQPNSKSGWIARHLSPEELDEPEVNTDYIFGLALEGDIATLLGDADDGLKLDGVTLDFKWRKPDSTLTTMLAATAGLAGIDGLFKIGVSYKRDWKAEPAWKNDEELMKAHISSLRRDIDTLDDQLEAFSMPLPDCFVGSNKELPACRTILALRKKRKELGDALDPDSPWRLRVSAGHLSLGQLMDLLKPLIR